MWYRKWSDGWIEQGGYYAGQVPTTTTGTVTFLKSFKNIYYTITMSAMSADVSANNLTVQYGHAYYASCFSRENTKFTLRGNRVRWYACGY